MLGPQARGSESGFTMGRAIVVIDHPVAFGLPAVAVMARLAMNLIPAIIARGLRKFSTAVLCLAV